MPSNAYNKNSDKTTTIMMNNIIQTNILTSTIEVIPQQVKPVQQHCELLPRVLVVVVLVVLVVAEVGVGIGAPVATATDEDDDCGCGGFPVE